MEFCVISPTVGLERYATLSKTHLVLAHEYERNHEYAKFYERRKAEGDFIILDNGAYEGYTYWDDLAELAGRLKPDVIVLPDFYLQPWRKTWHAAIAWLDRLEFAVAHAEFLYIPQSVKGDPHGFMESYFEAVQDPRITWLGIPRCLATDIVGTPNARVEFAKMVKRDAPHVNIHAFGMVNGDVNELPGLADAGVRSIDSSAPVWRGWNGFHIDDKEGWDQHGTPVDFNARLPLSIQDPGLIKRGARQIIDSNLEACGVNTRR